MSRLSSVSTTRRVRLSTRALSAAAVVAVGAGLVACDSDEIGAAAVVGDERYTVAELQNDVEAIADMPGSTLDLNGDLASIQSELITERVQYVLFEHLAQEENVEVTEASIDTYIDEQIASQAPDGELDTLLAQNNFTRERLRPWVRITITVNELYATYDENPETLDEAVAATADELGVKVNPRYGEWDGNRLVPASGSVSVPQEGVASASPTP